MTLLKKGSFKYQYSFLCTISQKKIASMKQRHNLLRLKKSALKVKDHHWCCGLARLQAFKECESPAVVSVLEYRFCIWGETEPLLRDTLHIITQLHYHTQPSDSWLITLSGHLQHPHTTAGNTVLVLSRKQINLTRLEACFLVLFDVGY